jgi:hypothetical protein
MSTAHSSSLTLAAEVLMEIHHLLIIVPLAILFGYWLGYQEANKINHQCIQTLQDDRVTLIRQVQRLRDSSVVHNVSELNASDVALKEYYNRVRALRKSGAQLMNLKCKPEEQDVQPTHIRIQCDGTGIRYS